jgi:hypothetical protein
MSTQIESVLRTSLADEAETVQAPPEVWQGFTTRERRHRRTRRTRRAAIAVAATAVLGAQSGLVPLPGWTPGVAVAGRSTALLEGPTRGSLAGDKTWLAGMRHEIKDVQDPFELWKVGDRSKIRFVYAADVAGHRLTLALVPLRFGFITDWSLMWYEGSAGAAPEAMQEAGRSDGGETIMTYSSSSADGPGLAVVVAPTGSTVSISQGFAYTPQGRVRHGDPVVQAPGTGLAEMALPPTPISGDITATVVQDGRTLYQGGLSAGWSGGSAREVNDAMVDAALGAHTFDRETLRAWIDSALHDARLPAAGTKVTLRWIGIVNAAPAALFTLRRPGTGVLAYAMHGSANSYRQDLRMLLPAAGVDNRPIAWRMRADGKDDRTDQLVVTAPPGAARVDLTTAGAVPVPVALDPDGFGTTTLVPAAEALVTAYRADGTKLASTPVLPFETNSGGIPGDDMKTRIVQ